MPETLPKEAELEEESSSGEEQYMLSKEKAGNNLEQKGEEPTLLRGTGEDLCEWVQRILNAAIMLKSDKLFWDEKLLKLYNSALDEYFKERHKVTSNDFDAVTKANVILALNGQDLPKRRSLEGKFTVHMLKKLVIVRKGRLRYKHAKYSDFVDIEKLEKELVLIRASPEYRMKTETLRKIITEPDDFVPGLNPLKTRDPKGGGKQGGTPIRLPLIGRLSIPKLLGWWTGILLDLNDAPCCRNTESMQMVIDAFAEESVVRRLGERQYSREQMLVEATYQSIHEWPSSKEFGRKIETEHQARMLTTFIIKQIEV